MDARSLHELHRLPDLSLAKYLTERQRQIVMLLSAGVPQASIADLLRIERDTVYQTLLDARARLETAARILGHEPVPTRMNTLMWCRWGMCLGMDKQVIPRPTRRCDRPASSA